MSGRQVLAKLKIKLQVGSKEQGRHLFKGSNILSKLYLYGKGLEEGLIDHQSKKLALIRTIHMLVNHRVTLLVIAKKYWSQIKICVLRGLKTNL